MPHSRETIIAQVNEVLIQEMELEPASITPEAQLNEDLGLDSLDAVDLILALEKTFGLRFDEEAAKKIDTVEALYGFVEAAAASA